MGKPQRSQAAGWEFIFEALKMNEFINKNNNLGAKNGPLGWNGLTHSFPTAKQLFPGFFTFFFAIWTFLRPKHDCYAKFTSCST